MYINNYYTKAIQDISKFSKDQDKVIELLRFKKIENCLVLWIKIDDVNYKFVIFNEKGSYKIFVFDSFNCFNVYEIYSGSLESTNNSNNIIKEGDYCYLISPLSGKLEKINKKEVYNEGDVIAIVSAMKMEHPLVADKKYQLVEIMTYPGQFVDINQRIVKIKELS
jgi:acetyl/propionyl-CoA carboxylase alpha subunit